MNPMMTREEINELHNIHKSTVNRGRQLRNGNTELDGGAKVRRKKATTGMKKKKATTTAMKKKKATTTAMKKKKATGTKKKATGTKKKATKK